MADGSSATEQFGQHLRELHEAAGAPTYELLVRKAAEHRPPVGLSVTSLSDWLNGRSLPARPAAVKFLVEYLRPRVPAQHRLSARPASFWLDLYRQARLARQDRRGGRPPQRRARPGRVPIGRPVAEHNPLMLEVHRAIEVGDAGTQLPQLPPYVTRTHDDRLRQVVDAAAGAGVSQLAVLVGGSSTGKTRACWEAVRRLPDGWRLVHPIEPDRCRAAVDAVAQASPYTVVWLNEARHYLLADPVYGERIAAGLRTLLADPARAPVLVLATLWYADWHTLTTRDPGGSDPYEQARHLLAGNDITVPEAFTADDLAALRQAADTDVRLRHAAEHAVAGRVTQHLAGVPQLLQRYRNAPPAARAVIQLAMDARRLGHPTAIPHRLLERAAPGYLTDHEWEQQGDDWLADALAYAGEQCHGTAGPLTRINPRPGDRAAGGRAVGYRLADFLEETGRTERADVYPPAAFWDTVSAVADAALTERFGEHAESRGRYGRAADLYRSAADRGNARALARLARLAERAGDAAEAEVLAVRAADRGYVFALQELEEVRAELGDTAGAQSLRERATVRSDNWRTEKLPMLMEEPTDDPAAAELHRRALDDGDQLCLMVLTNLRQPNTTADDIERLFQSAADGLDPMALRGMGIMREYAGDRTAAVGYYERAADRGETMALLALARYRAQDDDQRGADALYEQAAAHGDIATLTALTRHRYRTGDVDGAAALAAHVVNRGSTDALLALAGEHELAGDPDTADTIGRRIVDLGDTRAMATLALRHHNAGDVAAATALAVRAADRGAPETLALLARLHWEAGDLATAASLAEQSAQRGSSAALLVLAIIHRQTGDRGAARTVALRAANLADPHAVECLALLAEWAGDHDAAYRIRRYGLTDD